MLYVLGDSITKGVILNEAKSRYVRLKESFFALAFDDLGLKYKNYSMFGATIEMGLKIFSRIKDELVSGSTIFLKFGGNDCNYLWEEISKNPDGVFEPNVPIEDFKAEYQMLIQECLDLGLKPVIVTLPPLDSEAFFNYVSRGLSKENILKWMKHIDAIFEWQRGYRQVGIDLATEFHLPVLDVTEVFLAEKDYRTYLCKDGMHPNANGHKLMAGKVKTFLKDYFSTNGR